MNLKSSTKYPELYKKLFGRNIRGQSNIDLPRFFVLLGSANRQKVPTNNNNENLIK